MSPNWRSTGGPETTASLYWYCCKQFHFISFQTHTKGVRAWNWHDIVYTEGSKKGGSSPLRTLATHHAIDTRVKLMVNSSPSFHTINRAELTGMDIGLQVGNLKGSPLNRHRMLPSPHSRTHAMPTYITSTGTHLHRSQTHSNSAAI
jgi:hypothetical protein